MHAPTGEEKKIGKNRADFMRRFFSIAVSVGFASKLKDFHFLSSLQNTKWEEIHQFILLVFAMIVVVGSWEFYFRSIDEDEKPLKDTSRFVVDIIIVSLYIILLQSVSSFSNFLLYTDLIVSLYVIWDILSIRAYPEHFGVRDFDIPNVIGVYKRGFLLTGKTGPFTTLWWLIVFLIVSVLHLIFDGDFYVITVGTSVAYIMYRIDQHSSWKPYPRLTISTLFVISLTVCLALEPLIKAELTN